MVRWLVRKIVGSYIQDEIGKIKHQYYAVHRDYYLERIKEMGYTVEIAGREKKPSGYVISNSDGVLFDSTKTPSKTNRRDIYETLFRTKIDLEGVDRLERDD